MKGLFKVHDWRALETFDIRAGRLTVSSNPIACEASDRHFSAMQDYQLWIVAFLPGMSLDPPAHLCTLFA